MIKFIPFESDNRFGMKAFEFEKELGYCIFSIDGFDMMFEEIDCKDDVITEGLARASMNFAANRNAYIAKIKSNHMCCAFKRLGFSDELYVEIPEALTSGCSCTHSEIK